MVPSPEVETSEPTESQAELDFARSFEHHHAFIIGIDKYEHVSPLQTAVNDANKLAEVLKRQHRFLVQPPLLNARGGEIRDLLQETIPKLVQEKDRVLFYFAGHGIPGDGEDGPAGYIVPADAVPGDRSSYIPMEELSKKLDALPCRHLLLILDCCFSGAFKWSSKFRAMSSLMPKRIYKERFDRFLVDPAWQVITSAAYDQKALDVLDGKATGERGVKQTQNGNSVAHSPFALALYSGLSGEADVKVRQEGDGVITATELYAYIRDQIEPATIAESQKLRQTPGFFPLRKHDKGEFVFLHPKHRLNLKPIPDRSPYKGLQSFDEADKELFYGRDRVIKDLREKAKGNKLLVVSGASGTGKSSVIKAGLLPVLRDEGYRILPVIRPGINPVASLEEGLRHDGILDTNVSIQEGISSTLMQKLGEEKTVLLIDQFEELITRCNTPSGRELFVGLLRKMLDGTPPNALRIIITVRADFEPQLNEGDLKEYWIPGRCTVPPFSVEELKEVIVMPTMQEVLIFDPPELVDDIVEEVVQSPGALPLLSYTLSELYEAYRKSGRQDRALKREDYDKLGGVMGALRTKADTLYNTLDANHQNTMRKIMLRMVSVEGELAGKRVMINELDYADEAEDRRVQTVIEQLVDARLISKGTGYAEPAHDALVRAWKRLLDWIREIGEDKIRLYQKVNAPASDFAQSRNVKFLWNDSPLLEVLRQELPNPQQWLNEKEVVFIQKSVQRKKKLSRILRTITAGALVALSGLTVWALLSRAEAILNSRKDMAGRLTIVANTILPTDNTQALRIAEAAYTILGSSSSSKVQKALSDAFHSQHERPFYAANFLHDKSVTSAAFSPDGQRILTASEDGSTKLWNLQGTLLDSFKRDNKEILSATFSANGERIITVSRDTVARLWKAGEGLLDSLLLNDPSVRLSTNGMQIAIASNATAEEKLVRRLTQTGEIYDVVFSFDKQRILTKSNDGTAALRDGGGKLIRVLKTSTYPGDVTSCVFSSDSKRVLTSSTDSTIRFWDANGSLIGGFKHTAELTSAVFSPDGNQILTASKDHTAKLWDLARRPVHRLPRHGGAVLSAVFSPDGKRVLTASHDGTAKLWNEHGELIDSLEHGGIVNSAVFSPDGIRILTAARDGTAMLWSPGTTRKVITLHHRLEITTATFSPGDGLRILTASEDSTAQLWTTDGESLATFQHRAEIVAASFSPEGTQVLTVAKDSTAALWDTNGRSIVTLRHDGAVNGAVFSPDGSRILTVGADSTAKLWRRDGALIRTLKHQDEVTLAAISLDGRTMLTSAGRTVMLWNERGDSLATLTHNFTVTAAVFSPDGKQILTATADDAEDEEQSAMLWSLKGEVLVSFGQHEQQVNAVAFSRDGKRFTTASDDHYAMIWWTPQAIDDWLKTASVYRLSPQEEREYEIAK